MLKLYDAAALSCGSSAVALDQGLPSTVALPTVLEDEPLSVPSLFESSRFPLA